MGAASGALLVGRVYEVERLDGFVASLEAGSSAVLICGDVGIGKTSLWRAAVEHAQAAGVRVLSSRCAEVEMPIAFGALADLFEGVLDEVGGLVPAPQREALEVAFGRSDTAAQPEWLLLAGAVLACLRMMAGSGPVLVAVDDLQWLDPGSRRVLAWALRRAGTAPIGLLATLRDGVGELDPLALADALSPDRFSMIELGPLSTGALLHLVAERIGVYLPRPTLTRLHRASGGNPLFALEFARGLSPELLPARPALDVPASLEQLILARVQALPERLRPLLELVAALERPTCALLERALAGGDVGAQLEEAVRDEVLVVEGSGGVRFAHPLLASAVYFRMSPPRRRALHRRLVEVVETVEERGRHAALATPEPDAAVAVLVDEAAVAAAARGALDAAAGLEDEAVRLTPAADRELRCRRILAVAGWLLDSGEFAAARRRLDEALPGDLPAGSRAEALLLRAECEFADRQALISFLRAARECATEPLTRWQALIRLAQHEGWVSGDARLAAETAHEALETALGIGARPLVEISLAALAYYQAARGVPDDVPTVPNLGRPAPAPRVHWWQLTPALSRGCRLMWAGELQRGRCVLDDEYTAEERSGREARAGFILCALSELEWRAGEWTKAGSLADEATARLGDVNPTAFPRALVAATTGRVEEAVAVAEGALTWAAANEERVAPPRFGWLLGLLELSRGDAERAHALLAAAQAQLDTAGIGEPGYLPLLPDLAESLVALGRLDEAAQAVVRLEALAVALRHRWAMPAARRSRALLLLAQGDPEAAAMALSAAREFGEIGMPFECARALLVAGNAQRRVGERRRAAALLDEAARTLSALGALLWLEQAERELRRASPRPRRDRGELTAAELQVAALVAAGRKNKEVAAELYTTVATVEAHLTRIYRKLGVRSRSELAHRVAGGSVTVDRPQQ